MYEYLDSDRGSFTWTDKEGKEHKLEDIEDSYLANIIAHLERMLPLLEHDPEDETDQEASECEATIKFLREEAALRQAEANAIASGKLKPVY